MSPAEETDGSYWTKIDAVTELLYFGKAYRGLRRLASRGEAGDGAGGGAGGGASGAGGGGGEGEGGGRC